MEKTALRLRTGLLFLLALHFTPVFSRDIQVADAAALSAALASAEPGDAIVLAKSHWNDVRINVVRGGAEGKTLVIRAEVPGEVVLGGYSDLQFIAPYVTVDGLFF